MSAPLSYEALAQQRAREWERVTRLFLKGHAARQADVAAMPDVANAPAIGQPWSHPDLACNACGHQTFVIPAGGWVTVNGVRHRVQVVCAQCATPGCWDWTEKMWVPE